MGMARLLTHELGHNHGEEHEPNGRTSDNGTWSVMSYTPPPGGLFYGFSTGKSPYPDWLPMDRSLPSLREKYGGEYFPQDVVAPPVTPPTPPITIPKDKTPMDKIFALLLPIILEMLLGCIEDGADMESMLSEKGPLVRWQLRRATNRAARKAGLSRRERREANIEAQSALDSLTLEDIRDLIDDAK